MTFSAISLLGRPLESVFDSFAAVGFGRRTTLEFTYDRLYLRAPDFGIALAGSPDGRVASVLLYAVEAHGYRPFFGELPESLFVGEARRAVRDRLGEPHASGGRAMQGVPGKIPSWDRWNRPSYQLRVAYDAAGVTDAMVTSPEPEAPGLSTFTGLGRTRA